MASKALPIRPQIRVFAVLLGQAKGRERAYAIRPTQSNIVKLGTAK